jgi:preprotein translocase SecE subunit
VAKAANSPKKSPKGSDNSETAEAIAKRRVKNPETFRERAIKANEASDKPNRLAKVKRGFGKIFRPIGRIFKKAFGNRFFKRIFVNRVFRLIGRILLPHYFRSSWQELKLVAWPKRREARQLTFAVLAFAIVFGGVVALVDFGLDKLFKGILLK